VVHAPLPVSSWAVGLQGRGRAVVAGQRADRDHRGGLPAGLTAGLDHDYLRVQDAGADRRCHRRGGQGAVREQHLDQRPGPGRVAVRAAGGVPVHLAGGGEGAGCPGPGQRGGAGQRAGLAPQHLQVVVQDQGLGLLPGRALVPGHHPRPAGHLHGGSRQSAPG
jgi:hypothetical protein